jgi:hypothetical protein
MLQRGIWYNESPSSVWKYVVSHFVECKYIRASTWNAGRLEVTVWYTVLHVSGDLARREKIAEDFP